MAYVQDDRLIKDKGIPYKVVDRKNSTDFAGAATTRAMWRK